MRRRIIARRKRLRRQGLRPVEIWVPNVHALGFRAEPRRLMAAYNARGIFSNLNDDPDALRAVLEARYADVGIEIQGSVALFTARQPLIA